MSIRVGGEKDLAAACELWFRADGARRSVTVRASDADDLAAGIGELYRRPPVHLLLASAADGELVGTVLGKARRGEPHVGQISLLAVAPGWQGQGVGSRLLSEVVARLRSDGCTAGRMYVRATDLGLRRFYERRGWAATDEVEAATGGDLERVFVRTLDGG